MIVPLAPIESRREPPRWAAIFTGWYLLVILLLAMMTLIYAGAKLVGHFTTLALWFEAAASLGLFALFLLGLYFAEGSEIAATTVLERDEDELSLGNAGASLSALRHHADEFISGRQLIVVVLVILFAAYCAQLAYYSVQPNGTPPIIGWIFFDPVKRVYGYLCPILAALWLSQLYSKFVAQRRPAAFFRSPTAQFMMNLSIALGRLFRVGDVSTLLSEWALRRKEDDARTASRAKLYGLLAALRNGFGFERVAIEIFVDPRTGSTEQRENYFVRSYSAIGKLFQQDDELDGPVTQCWLDVHRVDNVAKSGPDYSNNKQTVKWEFELANPLKVGSTFDFSVRYHADPPIAPKPGQNVGTGATGEFYYEVKKYPVALLLVSVRPTDKNAFMLTNGYIEATVSDEQHINRRESARFSTCVEGNDSGLDFTIRYPLMGGTYKCEWTISDKYQHGAALHTNPQQSAAPQPGTSAQPPTTTPTKT